MIKKLQECIIKNGSPKYFVADPVPENKISIRLLEKNGYVLDTKTGLYKYII